MRALKLVGWVCLLSGLACINGPYNGTTHNGAITGASFNVSGYHVSGGGFVEVQVLSAPTADPAVASNWTTIGTATASSSAVVYNGDSLYPWSTTVVPVPSSFYSARWPSGGLAKLRAVAHSTSSSSTQLAYTFDDVAWTDCAIAEYGAGTPGQSIGINCQGLGRRVLSLVSTQQNPATLGTREFLAIKGDISATETNEYYDSWGAPTSLPNFKTQYVYPGTGVVTATYYNDGDLGVGREMHCWQYTRLGFLTGTACFVSNYSDTFQTPKFGTNNVTTTLGNAIAHSGAFATVAMVTERPILVNTPGPVNFVAFNAAGNRVQAAQLDNKNLHKSIPNNCLTCHGVDSFYDEGANAISGGRASFLPFDLASFLYSGSSSFTRAAQEEAFRKLNKMVRDATAPAPAITSLINGAYASSGGVATVGATWDDDYVPSAWKVGSNQDYPTLYKGVVRPYCRTCHMSAGALLPERDFAQASDFDELKAGIAYRACETSEAFAFMPHAEHPMRKFWASGARAYLNAWTGDTTGCKP